VSTAFSVVSPKIHAALARISTKFWQAVCRSVSVVGTRPPRLHCPAHIVLVSDRVGEDRQQPITLGGPDVTRIPVHGARIPGATGILTLRCEHASGHWEQIWKHPHNQTGISATA
jgi:hypothetical protein